MPVFGFCEANCKKSVYTTEEILTILQQLIESGSLAGVDPTLTPTVAKLLEENGTKLSFWYGTEAEFNALQPAPTAKEIMVRVGADGKVYFCTDCSKITDLYNNLIIEAGNAAAEVVAEYQGAIQTNAANIETLETNLAAVEAAKQAQHTSATVTLPVASWSNKAQTVSVAGVTADNTVFVAAAAESMSAYGAAGVKCTAQAAGSLTFTCDSVPEVALTVNIIVLGV